jgi:lycopene cyclase domain-containing protein
MPEYAIGSALSVVAVVLAERWWFRSGLLRNRAYWIAMGICLFFMVLTNGWLTKLSAPIVLYEAAMKTPWRIPWDIPIEDYGFGFSLLTLVCAGWERANRVPDPGSSRARSYTPTP